MANTITYGNYTFTDSDILSANITLANAMVSESLSADEFKFTVYHEPQFEALLTSDGEYYLTSDSEVYGTQESWLYDYVYGTPLSYYKDNVLQGKYYVSNVTRSGKYTFDFECVSAVGLLIKINDTGGVYEGLTNTVGNLIRGLFTKVGLVENTDYIIDSEINSVPVNGWLPYASCRDNLRQILFAIGASITKNDSGILTIKYISSPTLINIPDDKIYQGGGINYLAPCSKVEVWEHEYHKLATDESVVLFDNTGEDTAVSELITFDEPCHPNYTTGEWETTGTLTYSSIGANYAIVSGLGTLTGYKYTHTTRVITESITGTATDSVAEVQDATLVSTLNSSNVAKRIKAYYSQAKEISCEVVVDGTGIKPSSKVAFTNPFGEATTGYVKDMSVTVSGINKAQTTIATDWTPSHFGNNYGTSILLTSGTTWTSPKTGTVKIVLIQGGQGGQGGTNGENGESGTNWNYWSESYDALSNNPHHGIGGTGGAKGTGGSGGKILSFDATVTSGTSYTISIGTGGSGGASNGGTGTEGTHSTITIGSTTYTSADGEIKENGFVNMFTGDVYGTSGWDGINGQDANTTESAYADTTEETVQVQVSNDSYMNFTLKRADHSTTNNASSYLAEGYGADGGAGAFCYPARTGTSADSMATPTRPYAEYIASSSAYWGYGANGGTGASAMSLTDYIASEYNTTGLTYSLNIGQGGVGGNGGGGGGGGGDAVHAYDRECYGTVGYGGTGGTGSQGCVGANGGILIYY